MRTQVQGLSTIEQNKCENKRTCENFTKMKNKKINEEHRETMEGRRWIGNGTALYKIRIEPISSICIFI